MNNKYYLDTEFLEGTQSKRFGKQTQPTIDLISIGIVCEDNREYYAISKDFNLKEAWNRFERGETINNDGSRNYPSKIYWIRKTVLKPIFTELSFIDCQSSCNVLSNYGFTFNNLKKLIKRYGKTNKQIADEIIKFCRPISTKAKNLGVDAVIEPVDFPVFYGYYSDYDWVVFCWLFGKMRHLPFGFPMYCRDLKQIFDETLENRLMTHLPECSDQKEINSNENIPLCRKLTYYKCQPEYPKLKSEHNSLADAKWNKELHEFINNNLK